MCLPRQESPRVGHQRISPCSSTDNHFLLRRNSTTDISRSKDTPSVNRGSLEVDTVGSGFPRSPAWSWLQTGASPCVHWSFSPALYLTCPFSSLYPGFIPVLKSPDPAFSLGQAQGWQHLSMLITILFMCHGMVFKLFLLPYVFHLIKSHWARQSWSYNPHFTHINSVPERQVS